MSTMDTVGDQVAMDGVGIDGLLLCSSGMMIRLGIVDQPGRRWRRIK